MPQSLTRLREAFWYRYHRFPGYVQAKHERLALKLRAARWQIEDAWRKLLRPLPPLKGKTRAEITSALFQFGAEATDTDSPESFAGKVEEYLGFNIFFLEGRYFGLQSSQGDLNLQSLRAHEYEPCFVGHSVPDIKQEIELFDGKAGSSSAQTVSGRQQALFITNVSHERARAFLERLKEYDITVLATDGSDSLDDYPTIQYSDRSNSQSTTIDPDNTSREMLERLQVKNFDLVIAPFEGRGYWKAVNLEMFASSIANQFVAMFEDGRTRSYKGEDLNRVIYNKAYLRDMFRFIPPLTGKRVLEVGCSDGLACDLLLSDDPDFIAGVDSMVAVGCGYPNAQINYFRMDATHLLFKDDVFDLGYSLATLEHVKDPFAVMQEIKRVTRPGGYCKVNAGPLYHAPFGHHMFGYFDYYPWIHLRLSKEEIIAYAGSNNVGERIQAERGTDARTYIDGCLTREHLNGLKLSEYRLDEFISQSDIKVLSFIKTYEGEELLNENILKELSHLDKEDLIVSGFEVVFKVL